MATPDMTPEEWAYKADSEGGTEAAFQYGLSHNDLLVADDPQDHERFDADDIEFYYATKDAYEAWHEARPAILRLNRFTDQFL